MDYSLKFCWAFDFQGAVRVKPRAGEVAVGGEADVTKGNLFP